MSLFALFQDCPDWPKPAVKAILSLKARELLNLMKGFVEVLGLQASGQRDPKLDAWLKQLHEATVQGRQSLNKAWAQLDGSQLADGLTSSREQTGRELIGRLKDLSLILDPELSGLSYQKELEREIVARKEPIEFVGNKPSKTAAGGQLDSLETEDAANYSVDSSHPRLPLQRTVDPISRRKAELVESKPVFLSPKPLQSAQVSQVQMVRPAPQAPSNLPPASQQQVLVAPQQPTPPAPQPQPIPATQPKPLPTPSNPQQLQSLQDTSLPQPQPPAQTAPPPPDPPHNIDEIIQLIRPVVDRAVLDSAAETMSQVPKGIEGFRDFLKSKDAPQNPEPPKPAPQPAPARDRIDLDQLLRPASSQQPLQAPRSQRTSKLMESPSVAIKNDSVFFDAFSSVKVEAGDLEACKICVVEREASSFEVYLGGPAGLTQVAFEQAGGKSRIRFNQRNDRRLTQLRAIRGSLAIQQPFTNHLVLLDSSYLEVKTVETESEETDGTLGSPGKPEFKSFLHSKDQDFSLLRAGGRNLYVIDNSLLRVDELIPDFWLFNGRPTNPICAAGSPDAESLLGISMTEDRDFVLHYYNKNYADDPKVRPQLLVAVASECRAGFTSRLFELHREWRKRQDRGRRRNQRREDRIHSVQHRERPQSLQLAAVARPRLGPAFQDQADAGDRVLHRRLREESAGSQSAVQQDHPPEDFQRRPQRLHLRPLSRPESHLLESEKRSVLPRGHHRRAGIRRPLEAAAEACAACLSATGPGRRARRPVSQHRHASL